MRQLNPSQVRDLILTLLKTDPKTVLGLVGHMGIGKTVAVKQAADKARVPCILWSLAQEAPEDVAGIPDSGITTVLQDIKALLTHTLIKQDAQQAVELLSNMETGNYLNYKMPMQMKTVIEHERGIVFGDEINRAVQIVTEITAEMFFTTPFKESGSKAELVPRDKCSCFREAIIPPMKAIHTTRFKVYSEAP